MVLVVVVLKGPVYNMPGPAGPTKERIRIPDGVIVLLSENFFLLLSEMGGKSNGTGNMAGAKNMFILT